MKTTITSRRWLGVALALAACGDDGSPAARDTDAADSSTTDDPSAGPTTVSTDPSGSPTTNPGSTDPDSSTSATDDGSTSDGGTDSPSDTSVGADETGGPGDVLHEEVFDGRDGAPWPEPWTVVGDGVLGSDIDDGRGRMAGTTMHTGRIALPGFDELDAEVWATVTFEDPSAQGFGFYVRQNGGSLQDTDPPGLGYAVYFEGAYMLAVGIWRETNGVEEALLEVPNALGGFEAGVPYRVRFQCVQAGAMTELRAKVWPLADVEPTEWTVSVEDDTPELQNVTGSFAVDNYNYTGTGSIWIDDVRIARL